MTGAGANISARRFAFVDALRGFAALSVVLYHADEGGHITGLLAHLPAWVAHVLRQGGVGVAVFFVLRGWMRNAHLDQWHGQGDPCNLFLRRAGQESVKLCDVTKHTSRIPRCHTPRRQVLGDDAACTNYGAAADVDASKDDRL